MLELIKSLIGYRCGKPSKDKPPPIPPPSVRRGTSQNPALPKTKTDQIAEPPEPSLNTDPTPATLSQEEDESFRIPGPRTWEIPRDSPVAIERVEDVGKYMKRCHDCLERKGEVILGCGHGVCGKCFERSERCEWCIGCRIMLGL